MREELQELKRHIYEDGTVSDSEVNLLRDVFRRYGLGEEEARLLLDINNILSGAAHAPSFDALFVEGVTGYLIEGGAVSDAKWAWLSERMLGDAEINALERQLLATLAAQGMEPPAALAKYL